MKPHIVVILTHTRMSSLLIIPGVSIGLLFMLSLLLPVTVIGDNGQMSLPNRNVGKSFERVLGLGVVLPYPYYQKPRYRYPVYDEKGRGRLLYGYGGTETFEYKEFTPIEGHY